jgi:hypothetical protein
MNGTTPPAQPSPDRLLKLVRVALWTLADALDAKAEKGPISPDDARRLADKIRDLVDLIP